MSNLKLLVWSKNDVANSPLYNYRLDIDKTGVTVIYSNGMNGAKYATGFETVDEAKQWAWNHYNEKMQPYVNQDSITRTEAWFKKAKPEPTDKDRCTQIGCHFEEVDEMQVSLKLEGWDDSRKLASMYKKNIGHEANYYTNDIDRIELLDSLCDQIVTAVGVGYMMGFDMQGALNEVIRSNDSKMVSGKFEFDANGKIMKGKDYFKPDLTTYVKELTND